MLPGLRLHTLQTQSFSSLAASPSHTLALPRVRPARSSPGPRPGPRPVLAHPRFEQSVAPANLQKCVGGFLLYKFRRIFPGILMEDFSGHFFPQNAEKNPVRKSAKRSGGPKAKIREKSVLPKTDPKIWLLRFDIAIVETGKRDFSLPENRESHDSRIAGPESPELQEPLNTPFLKKELFSKRSSSRKIAH